VSLEKYREKEAPNLRPGGKRGPGRPTKRQKLTDGLYGSVRDFREKRTMENMAVHVLAERAEKERKDYMDNRKVDMDKIIAVAYGRRKQSISGGKYIKC
jgi:hypothetical protein